MLLSSSYSLLGVDHKELIFFDVPLVADSIQTVDHINIVI